VSDVGFGGVNHNSGVEMTKITSDKFLDRLKMRRNVLVHLNTPKTDFLTVAAVYDTSCVRGTHMDFFR
jgi:hypothetical protein